MNLRNQSRMKKSRIMADSLLRGYHARFHQTPFLFLAIQNLNEPTKSKEQKHKTTSDNRTMATLMASMSSDDEAPTKNRKGKDVDSSDDEDDEVDESFEFGGILVS
jgi:hypothetical protein